MDPGQRPPDPRELPRAPLASFDPLSGRVVDKMAGEIMKRKIDQSVAV